MITIEQAAALADKAHKGQTDLDGKPYIMHPLAVGAKGENYHEIVVGYLHDVVEDTPLTFDDLRQAGVSEEDISTLRLLTHTKDKTYEAYLQNIVASGNKTAIRVKASDLLHNMGRNDRQTDNKETIYQKHLKAYQYIKDYL